MFDGVFMSRRLYGFLQKKVCDGCVFNRKGYLGSWNRSYLRHTPCPFDPLRCLNDIAHYVPAIIFQVYNTSILTEDYKNYFEVALGYWLSGGGNPDYNFYKYSSLMGGSIDRSQGYSPILTQAQGKNFRVSWISV